jgi:hypothetical protein
LEYADLTVRLFELRKFNPAGAAKAITETSRPSVHFERAPLFFCVCKLMRPLLFHNRSNGLCTPPAPRCKTWV